MASTLPALIDRLQERNIAGACKLTLIPAGNITAFPDEVDGTVAAITIADSAFWREIRGTQWTQEFTEEWSMVNGAQVARATCALMLPKDRPELLDGLWNLKPGRYVVLHHDMNSTMKVMGTKDEPATVRVVKLQHGDDPTRSPNRYALLVEVVRRRACPFYTADPPVPAIAGDCPTFAQLLLALYWSAIEPQLSPSQLADAITSLGGTSCPSLCELIDEAIIIGAVDPTDPITVTLDDTPYVLTYQGLDNGRPWYQYTAPPATNIGVYWSPGPMTWVCDFDGLNIFSSSSDTPTPGPATGWTGGTGTLTVEDSGSAADVTAITDCLSPEQAAALLAALIEDGSCPTLCELITAAFEEAGTPENGFTTTGAGNSEYNTAWTLDGTANGKDAYQSGNLSCDWSGTAWVQIDDTDGTGWYQSTDDTTYPWEATGWTAVGTVSGPVPTLTQTGGGSTGATTIAACLSPEQADALVAELGAGECDPLGFDLHNSEDTILVSGMLPDPCGNTLELDAPDATVQLRDSGGAPIGSPVDFPSGTTRDMIAPKGDVKTTDGATYVIAVESNGERNLPRTHVVYKDAIDAEQATTGYYTAFDGDELYPDTVIPRREILNTGGSGTGKYASLDALIDDTLPTIPLTLYATWAASHADTIGIVLPAAYQGVPLSFVSETAANGTITISVNNGASFATAPFTAGASKVIFRRTTTTSESTALYTS